MSDSKADALVVLDRHINDCATVARMYHGSQEKLRALSEAKAARAAVSDLYEQALYGARMLDAVGRNDRGQLLRDAAHRVRSVKADILARLESSSDSFYSNVATEDRPPPVLVGMFDPIPITRDPLRQLGSDEE